MRRLLLLGPRLGRPSGASLLLRGWSSPLSTAAGGGELGAAAAVGPVLKMAPQTQALAEGVLRGDRLSLSRAITLIESTRESHRLEAEALLDHVVRERGKRWQHEAAHQAGGGGGSTCSAQRRARAAAARAGVVASGGQQHRPLRIGVAGPPGAGKSTFIEALGKHLLDDKGLRVAVIAVDPSSSRSGGSILGDKTRMYELARDPRAFVRACPTSGVLGGVARYTNDVVLLCQAAAFDVVFIETVGLGQSEIMVDQTADMLLLIVPPGGGDELQGVKKGIMEVADVIVVNKADGHLLTAAQHTAAEYKHALHFQRRKWEAWAPTVSLCSALERTKVAEVWEEITRCSQVFWETGFIYLKRREQGRHWMWNSLEDQLTRRAHSSPAVQAAARRLEDALTDATVTPRSAAEVLMAAFLKEQRLAAAPWPDPEEDRQRPPGTA